MELLLEALPYREQTVEPVEVHPATLALDGTTDVVIRAATCVLNPTVICHEPLACWDGCKGPM